ncbi:hypothetical protein Tco_1518059 [Tanacetum coccineum]
MRIDLTLTQKEETYQVILDIIKNSSCYNAFLITVDVPEIYMQQFWFTKILLICPRVLDEEFIVPPSHDSLVTFLNELGYKGQLKQLSAMTDSGNPELKSCGGSYINIIKDDGVLGRLKFIGKGELTQVYGKPIPDMMLNDKIKNSESYQTFLSLSTGLVPLKIGRGKGAKEKRETFTPKKKSYITADDNILPDPDEALKLRMSISKTKAEIAKEEGRVHKTHAHLVTKKPTGDKGSDEANDEQEVRLIRRRPIVKTEEEQLAADTKKAIKASKKAKRIQQQSVGSSEGAGITLEVPDEPKNSSVTKVDAKADWGSKSESDKSDEKDCIDIEEIDDEITESDNDNQVMDDAEKNDADKLKKKKAIEASVQANLINEVKNQLPKFLPKAVSDLVNPRIESLIHDVIQKNPALVSQSSSTPTQPSSKVAESLSELELK